MPMQTAGVNPQELAIRSREVKLQIANYLLLQPVIRPYLRTKRESDYEKTPVICLGHAWFHCRRGFCSGIYERPESGAASDPPSSGDRRKLQFKHPPQSLQGTPLGSTGEPAS